MLTLIQGDIFADNYQLVRLVDTGGFADVWEAVFINTGNTVALKIFHRFNKDSQNIGDYKKQGNLLHTNLLTAKNFGVYNGLFYLDMQFLSRASASKKIGTCHEAEIAKCLQHIAKGLAYLHAKDIIHGDIKPNNFLLDKEGNYYLNDGNGNSYLDDICFTTMSSKTMASIEVKNKSNIVTPLCYRAPELFDRRHIYTLPNKATDIWALGAAMFELADGEVPFGDLGGISQQNHSEIPDLPALFSSQLNLIIKKCLSKDAGQRPKAVELAKWADTFLKKGAWPNGDFISPRKIRQNIFAKIRSKSIFSKIIN